MYPHVVYVKNKRNSTKSMDYSQKRKLNINHGNGYVSISLVLTKYEQKNVVTKYTMIDPATGWFKIKQYDDKKSITVANIVKQEWLARYPRPYRITLDRGSEFISQDFCDVHK